jgi:hypothetical protein
MICQSVKREQWVDKLKSQLLKVPYLHVVFTLPHQLNSIARNNESVIYSLIMKVAWMTIRNIGAKAEYTPGMTSILHTFGSDIRLTGAAISSIKANDLALKERNCKQRLAASYS